MQVIVDIFAIYDDSTLQAGRRFFPVTTTRIVDTRIGLGAPHAVGSAATTSIGAPAALIDANTTGLSMNLTAIDPTKSTYLTVWPGGSARPTVSNINPHPGQIVSNGAITELGTNASFSVYNNAGSTNLVIDVDGVFEYFPYRAMPGDQLKTPASGLRAPVGSGVRTAAPGGRPVASFAG